MGLNFYGYDGLQPKTTPPKHISRQCTYMIIWHLRILSFKLLLVTIRSSYNELLKCKIVFVSLVNEDNLMAPRLLNPTAPHQEQRQQTQQPQQPQQPLRPQNLHQANKRPQEPQLQPQAAVGVD